MEARRDTDTPGPRQWYIMGSTCGAMFSTEEDISAAIRLAREAVKRDRAGWIDLLRSED